LSAAAWSSIERLADLAPILKEAELRVLLQLHGTQLKTSKTARRGLQKGHQQTDRQKDPNIVWHPAEPPTIIVNLALGIQGRAVWRSETLRPLPPTVQHRDQLQSITAYAIWNHVWSARNDQLPRTGNAARPPHVRLRRKQVYAV
jgi:cell envelope opacity-associated protein A